MKLSEAMMLGSLITTMQSEDIRYCALGVAGNAVGIPETVNGEFFIYGGNRYENRAVAIWNLWPWLKNELPESEQVRLIDLGIFNAGYHTPTYHNAIALQFNVLVSAGSMTLDQLANYIRSVEPDEPKTAAVTETEELQAVTL